MANIDSELAYFRVSLNRKFPDEISAGHPIPKDAIRKEVEEGPFTHLSASDREDAIKELEHNFTISQGRGATVFKDHKPWLNEKRGEIDFYYWNRLRRYYLEGNILPSHVVATLDKVTDEVLDFLGNPLSLEVGPRRGMVIGHVQSGKTTNYSALICKAADAGYKVVILLAGITNSLRTQTQERIDDTFIGKKSIFGPVVPEALPIQMYASNRRFPAYGTSRDKDFTRDAAGMYFSLAAHNEPIIFVTKKNKAPLGRLRDWLIEQGSGHKLDLPVLLIDDEADNASINTQKDPGRTTAINGVIREILALFPRSAYVGYTATPFANIFIDPDTDALMENDDIFPKHFIKALDAPSNYVGARRIFADDGDLRKSMVKVILPKDYIPFIPLSHKRDLPVLDIPESLYHAIRVFCLTRGLRILRGQGKRHCSMMINVSRFNDVQEKVLGHVYQYLTTIRNALSVNAGLDPARITDATISKIRKSFEDEFGDSGISFQEILRVLPEATASIQTLTVNMKGGLLEYAKHRAEGLHVIAIGGLALSRGLTLEDLTVSYILRNTAASDTLMQMARWFGYRPQFEDICRLYLPQISLDHYKYVHEATEELRSEVYRMQLLNLTPEHFGLRVRQSPLAIKITAANKMRSASEITLAQDYSGRHIEGYALHNNNDINQNNLNAAETFVKCLGSPSENSESKSKNLIWRSVSGEQVMALIKNFRFSEVHGDLGMISSESSLFRDYVSDRLKHDLAFWDVAIPQLLGEENTPVFAGHSLSIRTRKSGTADNDTYRVTGGANRVADPNDAQIALLENEQLAAASEKLYKGDQRYCVHRKKPLLIIHLFHPGLKPDEGTLHISSPAISLSFCMPRTSIASAARTYQVNKVYKRQLEMFMNESEEDEAILEDAGA